MKFFASLGIYVLLLGSGANVSASDEPAAAARYFTGSWKCGSTTLSFSAFAETSVWTRVAYGSAQADGTAVLGYVAGLNGWVFRDFHKDGAYADLSSPGPSDGRWQWTGPYYPVEGGPPLQDRMTYVQISATRFDRKFELLQGAEFVPTGSDSCTKVPA